MRRHFAPVLLAPLFAAVAACVPQSVPPAPAPAPVTVPVPPPVPTAAPRGNDWRDWPLTPGNWTWRRDGSGSIALFGVAGSGAHMTLRCDPVARRLYLSVAGTGTAPLTILTTSTTRTLAVQPTGGTPPYVAVALAPDDRLLDAMGFSRGHFVVQQPGAPTLVVPAWAEVERVTEDCRG